MIYANRDLRITDITDEMVTFELGPEGFTMGTEEFNAIVRGDPDAVSTSHMAKNLAMACNIAGLDPDNRAAIVNFVETRTVKG